jgi:hypothetical protein
MSLDVQADQLSVCATHIDASIGNLFAQLNLLAGEVVAIWSRLQEEGRKPTARDLAALRPMIQANLQQERSYVHGTGVVLEPGELADQEMFLEWWCRAQAGKVTPMMLNFNRRSESFYNYQSMPWFSRPRETGKQWVEGPFVDLYGADQYIMAFSVPIHVEGRFVGVAAADISLHEFERVLLAGLMRMDNEALIVNAEGRVVACNTANWLVGDMARQNFACRDNGSRVRALVGPSAGWSLIERPVCRYVEGAA